ncbi:TPA: 50S ribosomal protein L22 [Candidatus Campbellbacteria bacterium]|uniref:Large ribosomal subunit protein uL22 n=2 Tax=Candidatus Campbelliibacteriota TaxID=1752727 RepID=A0A1F5EPZ6_9BACT|nr:MAG: 50S ribosomal protein L22, large subunit ribosomal protein L22 [Candidatus Campbellbacteria bacterium GW2011_OD1_34_28]KKP75165.1 MAG: 50S ribosomal protein L22 [Candidatus Campbellbacteria bacterium GW2011_GWD2_35_24]KKP76274.1 MAG: 50S ribosomal protein L22, large subunit ribosomal protein L22 [Candidatus Campbellbacteria bacterium GW2011_GWC2_35_28]KKP77463.1 MAG: 50S ribosomal protein L22 [Candidatus Campbellbacteria bacterium GW2011_GWC1_35_31]KKP79392.1 MAG: 50S ribosomal protein 
MIKAELKNYRQSPRKVRLVADLIRGKQVERALVELSHLDKKASLVLKKLVDSAVANAKHNFNIEKDNLFIKEIRVDEGTTMKRWMPGARGRAFPFKRRTCRVFVALDEKGKVAVEKTEKTEKKTVKKVVAEKTTAKKAVKKTVKK